MAQFALDLSRLTGEYKERIDVVVKKIAFDMFSKVIMRSPVDTGRFRNNWQVGINQIPSGVIGGIDKGVVNKKGVGASKAKDSAGTEIVRVVGGDVIYLVNNLPYAERLEDGYSPQAEAGVMGVVVAEFNDSVDQMSREVNK